MTEKGPVREGKAEPNAFPPPETMGWKPLTSSITVERSFRIDGKKVVARATIPATVGQVLGMEAVLEMAAKIIVDVESKQAKVTPLKLGEN